MSAANNAVVSMAKGIDNMLKIGLTGGIGSGKSTVLSLFQSLGASTLNADQVAREVVEPNTPALLEIHRYFGDWVLTLQGELNRAALRAHIFNNAADKRWLESHLHPKIHKAMEQHIACFFTPYVVIEIPLLIEKRLSDNENFFNVDRILVVDLPETHQKERAMIRDVSSSEEIDQIILSQGVAMKTVQIVQGSVTTKLGSFAQVLNLICA